MPYLFFAFLSVLVFACVHLFAERTRALRFTNHSRFLSTASGVAIAYVFVDILPKLSKNDALVHEWLWRFFPYLERHVYIMALIGFLFFFAIDRSKTLLRGQSAFFYLSLGSYALFNFLIGYAVVDPENPEVQPLALFTFAMALHYFMNDYSLSQAHGVEYDAFAKWVLIGMLFLGWLVGLWIDLSPAAVGLVSAFIAGGIIMNVTRHELPEENPHSLGALLLAAFSYTAILLTIGG